MLRCGAVRVRPLWWRLARANCSPTFSGSPSTDENDQPRGFEDVDTKSDDRYPGISTLSLQREQIAALLAPINEEDIEIKPDGMIYLPEMHYRRILHKAVGPGCWSLMPRGEPMHFQSEDDSAQLITREYALFVNGKFVSQSMGEHTFYSRNNLMYGKACESAKSNALMRCCKDIGIASELWMPQFITEWKEKYAEAIWCEHQKTREKKKLWCKKKSSAPFLWPWKELAKSGS